MSRSSILDKTEPLTKLSSQALLVGDGEIFVMINDVLETSSRMEFPSEVPAVSHQIEDNGASWNTGQG